MKLQATTVATTTITGEVSQAELLAWIASKCAFPPGASYRMWVGDPPLDMDLNLGNPLRFTITWDSKHVTPPVANDVTTAEALAESA